MIHPLLVVGRDRICRWKRQDKLLEEIGYVVETISISGRTTAVVRAVVNCYAPTIIQFCPTRPERAEAPSPGHRPGLLRAQNYRPVRAKALKLQAIHKAFALTGRLANCYYTQGDALG